MRLVISAVLCAFAAGCAFAGPVVKVPVSTHDFGIVHEADGKAECRFAMVNTGDSPLVISGAKANCGCTTPRYRREPVAPGDTVWIDVAYDPDRRPGRFRKKIYIDTNAEPRRSVLEITGCVIASESTLEKLYNYTLGPAKVKDRFVIYGDTGPYESRGHYIEGYNASTDTIRPSFTPSEKGLLAMLVQPKVVPPGEQFIWSVVLKADKRGLWGPQSDSFIISSGASDADTLRVEAAFNIKESFDGLSEKQLRDAPVITVDNTTVDLGRITIDPSRPITVKIRIDNRGIDPLKIRRVYSTDPAVTLKLKDKEVKKQKHTTAEVSIDAARFADAPYMEIPVTIITNDPVKPVTTVRVVAETVSQFPNYMP